MKNTLAHLVFVAFLGYSSSLVVNSVDSQTFFAVTASDNYAGVLFGSPYLRVVLFVFVLANFQSALSQLKKVPIFLVILALSAAVSIFWSISPLRSAARALDLSLCIAVPLLTLARLGLRRTITIFWVFGSVVVLISLVLAVAGSDYARMGSGLGGAWRGIFAHKNSFGLFCASTLLLAVLARNVIEAPRPVIFATAIIGAIGVVQSASATAVIAVIFALLVALGASHLSRLGRLRWPALAVASLVLPIVAYQAVPFIIEGMGRDETLTGRTGLWLSVLPLLFEAPLGYGYGTSGGDMAIRLMREGTGWAGARSTHNSYLALGLDLGLPFALAYFAWLAGRLLAPGYSGRPDTHLMVAGVGFAAFHLIAGLSESSIGPYMSFQLALLIVALAACASKGREPTQPNMRGAPVVGSLNLR